MNRFLTRIAATLLVVAALLLSGAQPLPAQNTPGKEYQVKAAFLYNFSQFVDWPPAAFTDDNAPLIIGVLGDDPFGPYLDEVVRGEKVNNHPLQIQRYSQIQEVTTCHILFISRSEGKELDKVLDALKGRSILTVGDIDGFAKGGGMVRFVTEKGKIRFRINVAAAKASDLVISSKLLRAAEIVGAGED